MAKHEDKKIWLVEHPTHQYKEDVKMVAAKLGLRVVDSRFKNSINPKLIELDVPTLTSKTKKEIKDQREAAAAEIDRQLI